MPSQCLADCLAACQTIATIGLCKNAGKTTVLNYLLDYYYPDFTLGITSIGYDGEETDAITLLPKPRITVRPGMLAATTSDCLQRTEVEYELLCHTGISTNMGEVQVVRALSTGYLEVSGPAISSQVQQVGALLRQLGCQKVIIDGAAGRLSFASHADGAILAVGAAMSSEMRQVVKRARHLIDLLTLPRGPELQHCPTDQVFCEQSVDGTPHFIFRGALTDRDLEAISAQSSSVPPVALVKDATAIFISPKAHSKFTRRGGAILVRKKVNPVAVTINPMSPYGPWFDDADFLQAMRQATSLPVYNIMYEKVKRDDEQVEYRRVVGQGLSPERQPNQ